jgi:hypothetical protein
MVAADKDQVKWAEEIYVASGVPMPCQTRSLEAAGRAFGALQQLSSRRGQRRSQALLF